MLSQLRQNTKTILWIAIVAFVGLIFTVWGMNLRSRGGIEAGFVGKVGGARISVEEYRNEVGNQRAMYYENQNRRPGVHAEKEIADMAWESVVQQHLLWQEAIDQGLLATDEEVLLEIQTNPPPFIRAQPIFQTDSVYDHSKYLQALSDPGFDFSFLERYVRATLPLQKLQEYLTSAVRVTDEEARLLVGVMEEKATISFVVVDPMSDVKEKMPDPSESELASYYSAHSEDFRIPERRRLGYVELPKLPSADDETYAREKIEEAYDLIVAGEPFDEIAVEYSDDERSRQTSGDLGWIGKGMLPSALDSVAFGLEPGQMSEIIRTEQGFHILMVQETRQSDGSDEARISYIFSKLEASPLTIEQIVINAQDLVRAAGGKGLEREAEEQAYAFDRSEEIGKIQLTATFRISAEDAEEIFAAGEGDLLGPIEGRTAVYVFEISQIITSRVPPLEEIRDLVKHSCIREQRLAKARLIAETVLEDISGGRSLEQAASASGLEVVQADPFARTSTVPGIGTDNVVIAHAFALNENQTSGILENAGRFYIIRLDEKQQIDEEQFDANLQNFKMSLLGTKRQLFMTNWYERLRQESKIEDYRAFGSTY